jgi:hypothetical protein
MWHGNLLEDRLRLLRNRNCGEKCKEKQDEPLPNSQIASRTMLDIRIKFNQPRLRSRKRS